MKKSIIILALLVGGIGMQQSFAQPGQRSPQQQKHTPQPPVQKNNLDKQPVWGPTGNDYADYYYLPEVDCYFDVAKARFIYRSEAGWKYAKKLPANYKQVDLYRTYKVVVNEPNPYNHNNEHKQKFGNDKDRHDQPVIRDSKDNKYFVNKKHPEHKNYQKPNGKR